MRPVLRDREPNPRVPAPRDVRAALASAIPPRAGWAVLPETLAAVTELLRGERSVYEMGDRLVAAAQDRPGRSNQRTAGAVAVLTLRGMITPRASILSFLFGGGGGLESFREDFHAAVEDDDISAILMDIDSPGGLTDQVPETAAEIRAARGSKPIVAIANTMAASAAYYLAAQADEVVVTPSGLVGSIGVILQHEDWSKFNEDFGVLPTYITAGKYKADGNPDEPLSDTARAEMQAIVDEIYDLFVADVGAGRNVSVDTVRNGYGEGQVLAAQRALAGGMVDRVESFDATLTRLLSGEDTAGDRAGAQDRRLARLAAAATNPLPSPDPAPEGQAEGTEEGASDVVPPPPEREEATAATTPEWLLIPTPRH